MLYKVFREILIVKVILDTMVELIRWHFAICFCSVFIIFSHVFFYDRVAYTLGSYQPVHLFRGGGVFTQANLKLKCS